MQTRKIDYTTTQTTDMNEPAWEADIFRDGQPFGDIRGEYDNRSRFNIGGQLYTTGYSADLDFGKDEDRHLELDAMRLDDEHPRTTMARLKRVIRFAAMFNNRREAWDAVAVMISEDDLLNKSIQLGDRDR